MGRRTWHSQILPTVSSLSPGKRTVSYHTKYLLHPASRLHPPIPPVAWVRGEVQAYRKLAKYYAVVAEGRAKGLLPLGPGLRTIEEGLGG
jgi:hypothetical protein